MTQDEDKQTQKHNTTPKNKKMSNMGLTKKPRCSRRENSSWFMKIHRARSTDLHFACPHVAHRCNYWLPSAFRRILVCIRIVVFYRHLIRWNIKFIMLISKYILLDRGYEFDIGNNFMWTTNCKTWRDYCLIICHLSTVLSWYTTFWYCLPVIPGM